MSDFLMQYGEVFSIVMFFAPLILFLSVLYFIKRRWIWLAIPITIVVDLFVWGKGVFESPHGGVALVFLIPQIIVVAVISFAILFFEKNKKLKSKRLILGRL
jgi:preprotein translocase subunit YajC